MYGQGECVGDKTDKRDATDHISGQFMNTHVLWIMLRMM